MSLIRILRTAQVTLTHTWYVDETPTDAAGSVTVTVKRLDGTTLASGTAAHPGVGQYTFTPPAQAQVETYTVDWAGSVAGVTVTARDIVEVVGGFLFGLAEARGKPPPLDVTKYPTTLLASKRIEVEEECELICGQAFVPRFARVVLDGSGTDGLVLPTVNVRAVRAVSVAGTAWAPAEVSALGASDSGVVWRPAGAAWPAGHGNVIMEFEHGMEYPPETIREAAMVRLRTRLNSTDTSVPYRAISWSAQDGGVYRLSTPSRQRTGIPDVDAAYDRFPAGVGGFA
jgi:hypothetical protein